ncbi:hypothetical protein J7E63_15165 [Bacillus sp. ISL-75]|uniref:hypothetical protein n=1 Tax=Bacillus sp. ISL-75 TaxID=2819137 RepID=UPI001BEC7844|nr:hypothetical protein [Bacillus sp. ISL-75]MBT2728272.1 hypothetical protein [Bacillus sp. ISL-75]
MRQSRQYKSPFAAMLWSCVLPGFGQLYNKDYIVGAVLIGLEFIVNLNSNLNISLIDSFIGDINSAHHAIFIDGRYFTHPYTDMEFGRHLILP